jgi:hypothetical protein
LIEASEKRHGLACELLLEKGEGADVTLKIIYVVYTTLLILNIFDSCYIAKHIWPDCNGYCERKKY